MSNSLAASRPSFAAWATARAPHLVQPSRLLAWTALSLSVVLSGCSTTNPDNAQGKDARVQAVTTLEEHLARAALAEEAGEREKAREYYRDAARAYPVAQEPWQKLAQSYFNAGDYGNAILASQEVMQRDPKNPTAASVLAISGLRLSSQALSVLREQAQAARTRSGSTAAPLTNASIVLAARMEAESVARDLREVLGEPPEAPVTKPTARSARHRTVPATSSPALRPAAPRPAAAPAAGNPFDKLR